MERGCGCWQHPPRYSTGTLETCRHTERKKLCGILSILCVLILTFVQLSCIMVKSRGGMGSLVFAIQGCPAFMETNEMASRNALDQDMRCLGQSGTITTRGCNQRTAKLSFEVRHQVHA